MRFEDVKICDVDLYLGNDGKDGNFQIIPTDEIIDTLNSIRKQQGNIDLVEIELDNDVYYNFYLYFNCENKELKLQGVCNHGEKDDWVWYNIKLSKEEKNMFMFKIIEDFVNEELDK